MMSFSGYFELLRVVLSDYFSFESY